MGKVNVVTVGCKVNQAESEELKMGLVEAGYSLCADPAQADLCVVNTCTVTAESDRKCRKLIRGLHRRGAGAIVAAGCYAQVRPGELDQLPGVVKTIPNTGKTEWLKRIIGLLPAAKRGGESLELQRTRGFIKIQDGCERCCSYCIVPMARGGERSRPLDEIIQLVRRYLSLGTEELVLCGINLGRYRWNKGLDLAGLILQIVSLEDGFRVRLSSIELEDLDMSWIEEWSGLERVCPHLHLPLQSGDASILKDMGRGYGPQDFVEAAQILHSVWPQATLTTEVIVGYPGESEKAFQATVEVLEAVRPSRLHVFRFSPRPGTDAGERGDLIAKEVAEERSEILRALGDKWSKDYIMSRLGASCYLLVERLLEEREEAVAMGTTEDYIKATMAGPPRGTMTGRLLPARLCGINEGRARLEPWEETGS